MRKIIFLSGGFNPDSAPFNRFYTIYKMMTKAGFSTSIICVRPINKKKMHKEVEFTGDSLVFNELKYKNIILLKTGKNFLRKVLFRIKAYTNAISLIQRESEKTKSVLYLNTVDLIDYIVFYFVSKRYNLKYIKERSEYPVLIRHPEKFKSNIFKYLILPWAYKFFDGMVIMTQPLINFFMRYTSKDCQIVKIPMTVDPDRFGNNEEKDEKYIGYVGGLDRKKDGLDILIKSFSEISDDFPEYKLKIAGVPANKGEKDYLLQLAMRLNVEKQVHFVGGLSRSEIPAFLLSASVLVLARPSSKQAEGGFPTKLGEYLMTGKPVIVTDVGEISSYLENGKDAYIIQPDNQKQLSDKLSIVLNHPDEANMIGKEGRKTALRHFDYNNYINRMRGFIESLY